jgi:hypothetical protein
MTMASTKKESILMKKVIQIFLISIFTFYSFSFAALGLNQEASSDPSKRPHVHHTLPNGECLTSLNEEQSRAATGQSGGASSTNSMGTVQASGTVSAGNGTSTGPHPPAPTAAPSSTSGAQALDSIPPPLPRAPSGPGPGGNPVQPTAAQVARSALRAQGLDSLSDVPDDDLDRSLGHPKAPAAGAASPAPAPAPAPNASASAVAGARSASIVMASTTSLPHYDSDSELDRLGPQTASASAAAGLDTASAADLLATASARQLAPSFSGKYDYLCHLICCECCIDTSLTGRRLSETLLAEQSTSYPCCLCCDQPCCYRKKSKSPQRGGSISLKRDNMDR